MMIFKKYESALRDDVLKWLKDIGEAEILVGIPSFNSEDSIKMVLDKVAEGLSAYYPDRKKAILISDGGSLDDTREIASSIDVPSDIFKKITIYRGKPGKGTSFRAVFEAAELLNVKACIVIDSDLRSITSEWIKLLVDPILNKKVSYLTPYYLRHRYDGTITNLIVYPLTRSLYGFNIRQPIGGEFGLSPEIVSYFLKQDVWYTDVAGFGIDIWMTTSALNEDYRVGQVNLGAKVHQEKDPGADLGMMFKQVLGTMFYLMGKYEKNWITRNTSHLIPFFNSEQKSEVLPSLNVDLERLLEEFTNGFRQFSPIYRDILDPENYKRIKECAAKARRSKRVDLAHDLWARILYDIACVFHKWICNRRRLIDIMTPLYFGRTATHFNEVASLSNEEAEKVVEKQAKVFEKEKIYLIQKHLKEKK